MAKRVLSTFERSLIKAKVKHHCEKAEYFDGKIGDISNKDDIYERKANHHQKMADRYQKKLQKTA